MLQTFTMRKAAATAQRKDRAKGVGRKGRQQAVAWPQVLKSKGCERRCKALTQAGVNLASAARLPARCSMA